MSRRVSNWLQRRSKISYIVDPTASTTASSTASSSTAATPQGKTFPSGIKLLHNSEHSVIDIVLVHGLTGDRERTWTAKNASSPWPQSLLPSKVPNARVLTFGYDAYVADWQSVVSQSRIGDHSMDLLTSLATFREDSDTNNRPIIFICHSLGGLVCEDALSTASRRPERHLRTIVDCTCGIMFLGTPHHGSGLAKWGGMLAVVIGVLKQTNPQILAVLEKESEVLARVQDEFHTMVRSRHQKRLQPIEITCFFEELPLPGVGVVVPKDSAILPGYIPIGIHSNHMDMTKFEREDEPGFIAIAGELRRWIKELTAPGTQQPGIQPPLSLRKDKEVEENELEGSKPDSQSPPKYEPARPRYFTLIPFDRNAHFVDREDVFKQIDDSFKVKKGSQPKAALFGLGGIGKSQIALEYCWRRKERDPECSVFWVHAATLERFEETYKRIATECGIIAQEEAQLDATMLVKNWLESRHKGRWLMVIDNIDDSQVFFKELMTNQKTVSQCIPRTGKGSLLFTTRSRDIAVDLILPANPIPVPVLTKSEGAELLRSRLPDNHSEEHIVELLEELEYIPLAITQAAAFMSKRQRTVTQYLDLYRESDSARVRMLSYEFSDHARQYNSMESVAKTWTISFESIRKGNPRSADLLSLMCYFDRHRVPAILLSEKDEDKFDFRDAVAVLCAFSLIESDEAGTSFDMHSLVQLATKLWLIDEKKGEEDKWAFEALESLARNFPAPLHHATPEYWQLGRDLLPHAQLILAHSFKTQQDQVDLARATLLFSTSRYLHWRGAVMEAKAKNEESLQILERILGEKHLDTLQCMGQLAWMYPWTGMVYEGVDLGHRCLELRREALGPEHPETLDGLSDLAMGYRMQNRYIISEELQREAYEASQRVNGPEHLDTLNCLGALAAVLDDLGRYEEAEAALKTVIRIKSRVLGEESSSIFADMHNLALTLDHQNQHKESEELYRQVLALKTKVYGKTHLETVSTLSNLVLLLQDRKKYSDIQELSGWFSGEAELVQENENPRLRQVMRTLSRFSIRPPGDAESESYDSGYSDSESEEESPTIPGEEDLKGEENPNKILEVA